LTPSKQQESNLLGKVYSRLECVLPKSFISVVIDGYKSQLRNIDESKRRDLLLAELPIIARNYGASKELDPAVYVECIRIVNEKFSFLSIEDIKEAYRQFASGEIKTPAGEMYYGAFNALNLGRVLGQYNENRKKIVAAYLRLKNEKEEQRKKEYIKKTKIEAFESEFTAMIQHGKDDFIEWQQVPEFWYTACIKRDLLILDSKTAKQIFEKAEQLAEIEKTEENKDLQQKRLKGLIVSSVINKDIRSKVIARKLSVFIHVLNKDFIL